MDLRFLFDRKGVTIDAVAAAADVHYSTAWRWREGKGRPEWTQITKLYARGMITDDDLRVAGLAIPRPEPKAIGESAA